MDKYQNHEEGISKSTDEDSNFFTPPFAVGTAAQEVG
jgi:hypothetical protein